MSSIKNAHKLKHNYYNVADRHMPFSQNYILIWNSLVEGNFAEGLVIDAGSNGLVKFPFGILDCK